MTHKDAGVRPALYLAAELRKWAIDSNDLLIDAAVELERLAAVEEQIEASLAPHRAASGEWADAEVKLAEIRAALEAVA